jgi:hypothetical protein
MFYKYDEKDREMRNWAMQWIIFSEINGNHFHMFEKAFKRRAIDLQKVEGMFF